MINAFLPCRLGSQRIPKKNTRTFAGIEGGLLTIKLNQLLKSNFIDRIILSSNDPEVFEIAKKLSSEIILDSRPEYLAKSSTSTDELINYVPKIISEGHVLWTHTTSPFLSEDLYDKIIITYTNLLENNKNDSLMTVNKLQTFLWDEQSSYNYDRNVEKWPRTQTLSKLYEVNSGIFLSSIENYKKFNDRIGLTPFLFETEGYTALDIDWPEEFELAEIIYTKLQNHG